MDFLSFFSDFSILGLIVLILTVSAMYLVSVPNRIAFIIFTISQIIQIYIFFEKQQGFLILTMIFLIIMNVISYIKWTKNRVGINNDNKNESCII